MTWRLEEDGVLIACRMLEMSYTRIAELIGRSRNACIGRADRLGLADARPATNERRERVAARHEAERLDRERARLLKREASLALMRADLALGVDPQTAAQRALANGAGRAEVRRLLRPKRGRRHR